jgi:hypothetical protein
MGFNEWAFEMSWREYVSGLLVKELSAISKYFDAVCFMSSPSDSAGELFRKIEASQVRDSNYVAQEGDRDLYLSFANFNHEHDIQAQLLELHDRMTSNSRFLAVLYNPYLKWLYTIATRLGIRKGDEPDTFITETDLLNLAKISGFEVTSLRTAIYCPWRLGGFGDLINRVMPLLPIFRWLSLVVIVLLRPIKPAAALPSISIVIPARNEKGNIENALLRMPKLAPQQEVIFVEGNSSDDTFAEIERVCVAYGDRMELSYYKQTGKGKADAVRLGFSKAKYELLVILDADLTMPPELLVRFYQAYVQSHAGFINGSRLVYPMEGQAMRFLNKLGNLFFAKALSFVLSSRIGDSLCGTKLVAKRDYQRFIQWRNDFGDFDPFGDFELLFPASVLGLGIVDVPVRYRDRTYGTTNISRWRHGAMLLKMTLIGLARIKSGRV